ncbi:UDP-glucose 4-epimerase GalE [Mangrovicella endophytica]|uniref:UDP-glucose 4-epimerase GalE n=1 Tax=Mangrovicella endophytica TaxID=2066697 RepID=UPI000C9EBE3D|nr:UDP-glucose 4-epimerase GalE [Mangrovicella endophytica]
MAAASNGVPLANVLVVGGAGYIGSHTCLDLADNGFVPVVYDNLEHGHEGFVRWGPLEVGDIHDTDRLTAVLRRHEPVAIVHFAALIEVGESVREPFAFYRNNVAGTLSLLAAAAEAGVDKLVFSSTCATYGEPDAVPMVETHRQAPINPYGRSKHMVEQVLTDLDASAGFRSVILRYFNAAGADPQGRIGERHDPETHAIPLAIEAALGRRASFKVFGSDYPTRDGTCVRDFVHVMDLADAHTRAVRYLLDGGTSTALNLGTGVGTTVKEILSAIEAKSGRPLPVRYEGRRAGDAPALVADNRLARTVLGWSPRHDLQSIVDTAWNWHSQTNMR